MFFFRERPAVRELSTEENVSMAGAMRRRPGDEAAVAAILPPRTLHRQFSTSSFASAASTSSCEVPFETPLERVAQQLRALLESAADDSIAQGLSGALDTVTLLAARGDAKAHSAISPIDANWLSADEQSVAMRETRQFVAQMVTDGHQQWMPEEVTRKSIQRWRRRAGKHQPQCRSANAPVPAASAAATSAGAGGGGSGVPERDMCEANSSKDARLSPVSEARVSSSTESESSARREAEGTPLTLSEEAAIAEMGRIDEPGSGVRLGGGTWAPLPEAPAEALEYLRALEVHLLQRLSCDGAGDEAAEASHQGVDEAGDEAGERAPSSSLRSLSRTSSRLSHTTVDDWSFDVVALDAACAGHCVSLLFPHVLRRHRLYDALPLDAPRLVRFCAELERRYGANPYHNRMHAADVLLGVHRFLSSYGIGRRLSPLHTLAALLGALVHDFGHPGTTNAFEVATSSARAIAHSDSSVLERHHLHAAFTLLGTPGYDFLRHLPRDAYRELRRTLIDMVLHTDLKRHYEMLARLKAHDDGALSPARLCADAATKAASARADEGDMAARPTGAEPGGAEPGGAESAEGAEAVVINELLLALAIKASDLGHSFKPWAQHARWSSWVSEEFFLLGDRERAEPACAAISPLCDRHTVKDTDLPANQIGFFQFIVIPFYAQLARVMPEAQELHNGCLRNLHSWTALKDENRDASGAKHA